MARSVVGDVRFVAACCGAAMVACAGARTSGSTTPDQQSIAEYDVARDAFQNGKLREALEHVEKALSLDDENADAAYLGATILLLSLIHI